MQFISVRAAAASTKNAARRPGSQEATCAHVNRRARRVPSCRADARSAHAYHAAELAAHWPAPREQRARRAGASRHATTIDDAMARRRRAKCAVSAGEAHFARHADMHGPSSHIIDDTDARSRQQKRIDGYIRQDGQAARHRDAMYVECRR